MRPRDRSVAWNVRDQIPGANYHELALELFRTIDDMAINVTNAIDDIAGSIEFDTAPIVKAINDLGTRLETIEDQLTRIASVVKEMGPV